MERVHADEVRFLRGNGFPNGVSSPRPSPLRGSAREHSREYASTLASTHPSSVLRRDAGASTDAVRIAALPGAALQEPRDAPEFIAKEIDYGARGQEYGVVQIDPDKEKIRDESIQKCAGISTVPAWRAVCYP